MQTKVARVEYVRPLTSVNEMLQVAWRVLSKPSNIYIEYQTLGSCLVNWDISVTVLVLLLLINSVIRSRISLPACSY